MEINLPLEMLREIRQIWLSILGLLSKGEQLFLLWSLEFELGVQVPDVVTLFVGLRQLVFLLGLGLLLLFDFAEFTVVCSVHFV